MMDISDLEKRMYRDYLWKRWGWLGAIAIAAGFFAIGNALGYW